MPLLFGHLLLCLIPIHSIDSYCQPISPIHLALSPKMPINSHFYCFLLFIQIFSFIQSKEFCDLFGNNLEQTCENQIPTDVCKIVFGPNKADQKRPKLCESPCENLWENEFCFNWPPKKIYKRRHFNVPNIVEFVVKGMSIIARMGGIWVREKVAKIIELIKVAGRRKDWRKWCEIVPAHVAYAIGKKGNGMRPQCAGRAKLIG